MLNFDYRLPTRIVFGRDTHKQIGSIIKGYASRVLLHYGSGSIKKTGLYDAVVRSLTEAGVSFVELGGVVPNPRISLANEGVRLCREQGVEMVLAVGGGSVIDSAKAICLGLGNPDMDLWTIFARGLTPKASFPLATVLTLPATGSEASNSCIMSNDATQQKYGCNTELNRPVVSVLDPTLYMTLPKNQIANGICDMMCHIMERYFSNTENTQFTDALCEATFRTLLAFGPKVYDDPTDYDSWCQVVLAGTMAHNNVLGLGREQDWSSHKLEHELSAIHDVAHGAGLAVIYPGWMRYVRHINPRRFTDFATRIMGVAPGANDDATALAGIEAFERFLHVRLNLPARLSAFGVTDADIARMSKNAVTNEDGGERRVGFFKHFSAEDCKAVYELVK